MTLTNPVHIAFIVAIALIFLGPKRLPEVARGLGTGLREFRETLSGGAAHHDQIATLPPQGDDAAAQPSVEAVAAAPPAPHAQ